MSCDHIFLPESSSWVNIMLHAKNQLPRWSGSGLKVCGGGVGGLVVYIPITLSLQLELCWVELGCDNILQGHDKGWVRLPQPNAGRKKQEKNPETPFFRKEFPQRLLQPYAG